MIRKTLAATQAATFAVNLPEPTIENIPWPVGTGFFVSADGFFVTARHVIVETATDQTRSDLDQGWLTKELRSVSRDDAIYYHPFTVVHEDPKIDVAVLRVDFAYQQSCRPWLKTASGFPFVRLSRRILDEGEPVYSFGYPLSSAIANTAPDGTKTGAATLNPRVTSAIVSANLEASGIVTVTGEPAMYVLDKALNYGNSGGPIVAVATGHVHAVCTRFQPVEIPQSHLIDDRGNVLSVRIPSLYGVVSPLAEPRLLSFLEGEGVEVADD